MEYDVFISHASEDKADVARPLAIHLQSLGLKVWIDELELTLGDSLRRTIDHGLSRSKYGLVILSPAFFLKEWPNKELDGLVAREDGRGKIILPIWHNVTGEEILQFSPILADKVAVSTALGLAHVAKQIFDAVRRERNEDRHPKLQVKEMEAALLERLRKKMLVSDSSWELRETLYELEAHLANYPHSPDARMLRYRLHAAMRHTEQMERHGTRYKPAAPREAMERRPPLYRWLIIALALGLLTYVLFHILDAPTGVQNVVTTDQVPLSANDLAAIENELAGYAAQVRKRPMAAAALQPKLKTIAERFWADSRSEPAVARSAAISYRLYAASILTAPSDGSFLGTRNATPWIRRSLETYSSFVDQRELEAANEFFLALLINQPPNVELEQLLQHQFRVGMVEAREVEVDQQVESVIKILRDTIKKGGNSGKGPDRRYEQRGTP